MSVVLFGILALMGALRHLWWRPEEREFGPWIGLVFQVTALCVVLGLVVEVIYLAIRYRRVGPGRERRIGGALSANYLAAAVAGVIVFLVLSTPLFDRMRTGTVAGVATTILLLATAGLGAYLHVRWAPPPDSSRAGYAGALVTLSGQWVVSLAAAAMAGKIYLLLTHPEISWFF